MFHSISIHVSFYTVGNINFVSVTAIASFCLYSSWLFEEFIEEEGLDY